MDLKKAPFQILRLSFPVKAHFYNGFFTWDGFPS